MSTIVSDIPKTYDEAVQTLARWHGEDNDADVSIFSFPDPEEQVVRLIEVSREFPTAGDVRPFTFGRSIEFPFKSSVALVVPEEWEKLQSGQMSLPSGWDIGAARRVWPN